MNKKKEAKRDVAFTIRMTSAEKKIIDELADENGKTITRHIIDSATGIFICPLSNIKNKKE